MNGDDSAAELIRSGGGILGIEFGSTRIKASLIAPDTTPLASGSHAWENQLRDGIWTYDMEDVWNGLAACYASLVRRRSRPLRESSSTTVAAIGFSGMMHGYVALDVDGRAPRAVPDVAEQHHRQGLRRAVAAPRLRRPAALEHRPPVPVDPRGPAARSEDRPPHHAGRLRALEAHRRAQDGRRRGVGDVPHRPDTGDWDAARMAKFDALVDPRKLAWKLRDILPEVMPAGREAGRLTAEGARLLDPSGRLPGRHPALSARGRRRHGHGRHERGASALGKRLVRAPRSSR